MSRDVLETFEAPTVGEITHSTDELSGLCPFEYEGVRDYYTVEITYTPDERCVELRSLKHYFENFQDQKISHEDLAESVFRDLYSTLFPVDMTVDVMPNIRGGVRTEVTRSVTKYDEATKLFQQYRGELRHAVTLPMSHNSEAVTRRRHDRVIGAARYRTCVQKPQTTLYDIVVDEKHRRTGVGTYLVDRIASASPHDVIVAKCPSDSPATRFYEAMGWDVTGTDDGVSIYELVV